MFPNTIRLPVTVASPLFLCSIGGWLVVWCWRARFKCNTSFVGSTVRTFHCVCFNFAARMRDSAPINEFERRRWRNINHVACYILLYTSPFGISPQACILLWIINSMTYPCFISLAWRHHHKRSGGSYFRGFSSRRNRLLVWQNRRDNSRWEMIEPFLFVHHPFVRLMLIDVMYGFKIGWYFMIINNSQYCLL